MLHERTGIDPVTLAGDLQEHRVDELVVQEPWPQAQLQELGVLRVVVVILCLDVAGSGLLDLDRPAEVSAAAFTRSASSSTVNCSVNWL